MKVGLVQYRAARAPFTRGATLSRAAQRDRSLTALSWLIERAAGSADLVVLPEMASTGYVFPDRAAVAEVAESPDGPTFQAWSALARQHRCWLVGGFPERDGDRLFNSALVIDPSGARVFVYRKTMLYDEDLHWATPGDSGYQAFDTDAGRFGVGICMDLNDDRFLEWAGDADLDAIAFPTNWVASDDMTMHTWVYWAWRMRGQRAALLAANTWGTEAGTTFTGESVVLHRERALAALPVAGNGVVHATVPSVR